MHRAGLYQPRRRGHHDGAHEVGAQGSPMHVAGRSITSRGRCSPSYKAAFSMTRTTNVHMARWCGSTEPALRKAGVRLGGHVRPLCRWLRKSPFTLALDLLAHALPQPGCVHHTQALRAAGVAA